MTWRLPLDSWFLAPRWGLRAGLPGPWSSHSIPRNPATTPAPAHLSDALSVSPSPLCPSENMFKEELVTVRLASTNNLGLGWLSRLCAPLPQGLYVKAPRSIHGTQRYSTGVIGHFKIKIHNQKSAQRCKFFQYAPYLNALLLLLLLFLSMHFLHIPWLFTPCHQIRHFQY